MKILDCVMEIGDSYVECVTRIHAGFPHHRRSRLLSGDPDLMFLGCDHNDFYLNNFTNTIFRAQYSMFNTYTVLLVKW